MVVARINNIVIVDDKQLLCIFWLWHSDSVIYHLLLSPVQHFTPERKVLCYVSKGGVTVLISLPIISLVFFFLQQKKKKKEHCQMSNEPHLNMLSSETMQVMIVGTEAPWP